MNQDISSEERDGLIQKIYGNESFAEDKENTTLTVMNPRLKFHNNEKKTPTVM